jgi:hypothetical protein
MVETCIIPPPIMMQSDVEARELGRVFLSTDLPILARASVGGNVLKMLKKSLFRAAMQRRYGQRRAMNVCGFDYSTFSPCQRTLAKCRSSKDVVGFSDRLRPSLLISNHGMKTRRAAGVASQNGYASSISFWPAGFEQCGSSLTLQGMPHGPHPQQRDTKEADAW